MKKLTALLLSAVMMFAGASTVMAAYDEDSDVDVEITRAEFVEVLYRIEKTIVTTMYDFPNVFEDVEVDSEHENAISWAAAAGVVNGTSATTFEPDAYITREQMATMMYRYYNHKNIGPDGAWAIKIEANDVAEISDYALNGIMFAIINEMLSTDENGNINPKGVGTGEELREFIGSYYFNKIK